MELTADRHRSVGSDGEVPLGVWEGSPLDPERTAGSKSIGRVEADLAARHADVEPRLGTETLVADTDSHRGNPDVDARRELTVVVVDVDGATRDEIDRVEHRVVEGVQGPIDDILDDVDHGFDNVFDDIDHDFDDIFDEVDHRLDGILDRFAHIGDHLFEPVHDVPLER